MIYKKFTAPDRWQKVAQIFQDEVFFVYGIPKHAMVTQTLQAGISVIKTAICDEKHKESMFSCDNFKIPTHNECTNGHKCPVCQSKMS